MNEIAYVEVTIHDTTEGVEGGGVDKERWDKVYFAHRLGMLSVLRAPATRHVTGVAERAGFSSESRNKRLAIDRELIGAACELKGKLPNLGGGIGSLAREGTTGCIGQIPYYVKK